MERVVVPFAREVDPLYASPHALTPTGVSKLVPHEVQVALAAQHFGEQPNQMEHVDALRHYDVPRHQLRHARVHRGVHQPERQRLVPHERLIVALVVAHVLLADAVGERARTTLPSVGDRVENVTHVPVLQTTLLQQANPLVCLSVHRTIPTCYRHVHAVVEADAAAVKWRRQQWVARHVLSDGEGGRVEGVEEVVGEREIGDGLDVYLFLIVLPILHVAVEPEIVLIIAVEPSRDGVVVVQHRRDAVEAKPIDVELLDEVEDLSQEELHHFAFLVIEALGPPEAVVARLARREVLRVRAIEVVQSVAHVRRGVAICHHTPSISPLHKVDHDEQSGLVNRVDQSLQCDEWI